MALTKNCARCGTEQVLSGVTTYGLEDYRRGMSVELAFPTANLLTRQMLTIGRCLACQPTQPPFDEVENHTDVIQGEEWDSGTGS